VDPGEEDSNFSDRVGTGSNCPKKPLLYGSSAVLVRFAVKPSFQYTTNLAAFPPSIARALSIPAYCRTGTINDVEHIVIMMQENRSFDHYYGTLTICDAYHCSLFGPTDPNRYYYSADGRSGPWTYTVAPDTELSDSWNLASSGQTDYHLSVFGPNAFLRIFKGSIASGKANIATNITYDIRSNGVVLGIHNRTDTASKVSVSDHYTHRTIEFTLEPNGELSEFWLLDRSSGWYDFTIRN
jgi:hypothetical protein